MKIYAVIVATCAVANAWAASVTVRAVVPPVVAIRDGTHARLVVKAGMIVVDADELIGGSDLANVQLECPNGATQTLSGTLHALVNARGAKSRCAIDLKSGTAVATALASTPNKYSDADASISGGPYAMTSRHTQFGLTLMPGAQADTEAFVIDGEALVSGAKTQVPQSLKEGQTFSSLTSKIEPIPEQTFQRIATIYTQLDLAQLGGAAMAQVAAALQSKWLAALRQPTNAGALKALADMHNRLGLSNSLVSKYQIARTNPAIGVAAPGSTQFGDIFEYPMQGEYRLDFCLPNNRCGKEAAIAWCTSKEYSGVAKWAPDYDIGDKTPTMRMGASEPCNRGACDGFASITCE